MNAVGIVGAGTVGSRVALAFARSGRQVTLFNRTPAAGQRAVARIRHDLEVLADSGWLTVDDIGKILARVRRTNQLGEAVRGQDHVVECVADQPDRRREVQCAIAELAAPDTLIASQLLTPDAEWINGEWPAPERIVPVLYHYPAHLAPLVEIVPTEHTPEPAVAELSALISAIGKHPSVRLVAAVGPLAPRFQRALAEEARRVVKAGAATPEQLDELFRQGLGAQLAATGIMCWQDSAGVYPDRHGPPATGPDRATCQRMAEQVRPLTVGTRVSGPVRPAGQVFVDQMTIQPFIESAVREYQALADYLAGRLETFPGCWALLVGQRWEDDGYRIVRLAHARSVRTTNSVARAEFAEMIIPRFGPAYANEARGFWCDSAELLRIAQEAEAADLEILGAIHFHSDWHRIGPAHERGLHLSEYPTPMDQHMIRNTGWPVHMICYLEQRDGTIFGTLGAWEPSVEADGACKQLSVLISTEAG